MLQRTLAGYAAWVERFLDALGADEPVLVLGHSFGGGIATRFAHDRPERVRYLVLLNSVGDPRSFAAAYRLDGRPGIGLAACGRCSTRCARRTTWPRSG